MTGSMRLMAVLETGSGSHWYHFALLAAAVSDEHYEGELTS